MTAPGGSPTATETVAWPFHSSHCDLRRPGHALFDRGEHARFVDLALHDEKALVLAHPDLEQPAAIDVRDDADLGLLSGQPASLDRLVRHRHLGPELRDAVEEQEDGNTRTASVDRSLQARPLTVRRVRR